MNLQDQQSEWLMTAHTKRSKRGIFTKPKQDLFLYTELKDKWHIGFKSNISLKRQQEHCRTDLILLRGSYPPGITSVGKGLNCQCFQENQHSDNLPKVNDYYPISSRAGVGKLQPTSQSLPLLFVQPWKWMCFLHIFFNGQKTIRRRKIFRDHPNYMKFTFQCH